MSTIYNVQPAGIDIVVTKGDTFDVSFNVDLNGEDYSITGQLDMKIKKPDGTLVKTLSSAGESPAITIDGDSFNVKTEAFTEVSLLKYDVQETKDGDIYTIQKGKIIVTEEQTTES